MSGLQKGRIGRVVGGRIGLLGGFLVTVVAAEAAVAEPEEEAGAAVEVLLTKTTEIQKKKCLLRHTVQYQQAYNVLSN